MIHAPINSGSVKQTFQGTGLCNGGWKFKLISVLLFFSLVLFLRMGWSEWERA